MVLRVANKRYSYSLVRSKMLDAMAKKVCVVKSLTWVTEKLSLTR